MKLKKLLSYLESIAPPAYQESYDNAGLIVGHPDWNIKGVLVCLDATEEVLKEAIKKDCNVVVAHHPIVFRGLKRLNGYSYVERVVMMAVKHDIAIYAIHTNLDNVYYNGVNTRIAERLGLQNTRILAPKQGLKKLYAFVAPNASDQVRAALFAAGAGEVGDTRHLSYATVGAGTRDGQGGAQVKIEMIFDAVRQGAVVRALREAHPEADPAYDIVSVENSNTQVGAGMIGELSKPMKEKTFLRFLKKQMQAGCVKYTQLFDRPITRVAVCGGAGGFLLRKAIAAQADIFITADYKYHEFFDADGRIIIADIGHYESEQYTIDLLFEVISQKFSTFAAYCTTVNTNPVNYL
ncbi:MAG: Nif3-like dinuclear metal center hexameric protein [Bacteroidota bacterium]